MVILKKEEDASKTKARYIFKAMGKENAGNLKTAFCLGYCPKCMLARWANLRIVPFPVKQNKF